MGIVEVRRAPDFLEQELVGDHVARVLRQYLKEPVFLRREHDARALDGDNAGSKIDGKGTDLDHRLARRGTGVTAQRRVCAREQLRHAERLDHVIVGTILKQAHLLRLVRAHREHDHRHGRPAAQALEHFRAVHIGQAEIENDDVGRLERGELERLGPVLGFLDEKAVELEARAQEAADLHFVVNNQRKRFTHRARPPAGWLQTAGESRPSCRSQPRR